MLRDRIDIGFMKMAITSIALVLALAGGCSTANPKAYNIADAPARLLTVETNGIRVSVDAIVDRDRSQKYFSTDTVGKGIVPVFIKVENLSAQGSVLVEKELFKVSVNAEGMGNSPMAGEVRHETIGGTAVLVTGALAVSAPLLIVGATMISTADEIRHNFVDKEFRNQSLAAGRSAQGFVYCQMKDRKEGVRTVNISIPIRNLQNDQESLIQFVVQK